MNFCIINLIELAKVSAALCNNCLYNAQKDMQSEPSKFQSFIRSKKLVSKDPGCMKPNYGEFGNSQDIIEAFADYFSGVGSNPLKN